MTPDFTLGTKLEIEALRLPRWLHALKAIPQTLTATVVGADEVSIDGRRYRWEGHQLERHTYGPPTRFTVMNVVELEVGTGAATSAARAKARAAEPKAPKAAEPEPKAPKARVAEPEPKAPKVAEPEPKNAPKAPKARATEPEPKAPKASKAKARAAEPEPKAPKASKAKARAAEPEPKAPKASKAKARAAEPEPKARAAEPEPHSLEGRILALVAIEPLRFGEIQKRLGVEPDVLRPVLIDLRKKHLLSTTGQAKGMRYMRSR